MADVNTPRPTDDMELWIGTAEAVLARGRSLLEAVETADRVMSAFWANANQPYVRARPGLAKCGAPSSSMICPPVSGAMN
jgi:hypothetical protein